MIGFDFELVNKESNYLFRLLRQFDFDRFIWHIPFHEVYPIDDDVDVFPERIISGDKFKEIINNTYYLVFASIGAFPIESSFNNVTNYKEYRDSTCYFYLICVDSCFGKIFCKDTEMLNKIKKECNGEDILFINDIVHEDDQAKFY